MSRKLGTYQLIVFEMDGFIISAASPNFKNFRARKKQSRLVDKRTKKRYNIIREFRDFPRWEEEWHGFFQ